VEIKPPLVIDENDAIAVQTVKDLKAASKIFYISRQSIISTSIKQ
jgi:hypothetical protein